MSMPRESRSSPRAAAVSVPATAVLAFGAVALTALYSVGVVLPSLIGSCLSLAGAIGCFLVFRFCKVPVLSLSRASVVFYVYVASMFFWPAVYPQILIAVHSPGFQTPEIFAKANHLAAIGLSAFLAAWLVAFGRGSAKGGVRAESAKAAMPRDAFWFLILAAIPFLILSFPTESIFTHVYDPLTPATIGAGLEINVLKSALLICLLLGLVSLGEDASSLRKYVLGALLAFAILVVGFARGSRVEELGCLLGVGWVLQSRKPLKKMP